MMEDSGPRKESKEKENLLIWRSCRLRRQFVWFCTFVHWKNSNWLSWDHDWWSWNGGVVLALELLRSLPGAILVQHSLEYLPWWLLSAPPCHLSHILHVCALASNCAPHPSQMAMTSGHFGQLENEGNSCQCTVFPLSFCGMLPGD